MAVDQALATLVQDLRAAASGNLLGVALYGGLAKGRYTPGISDINVLVVLRTAGLAELEVLAPALTGARRAHQVVPFVATPDDLRALARLFPVKLLDMQAAHRVLYGDPHLAGIAVDRDMLRQRAHQELKNIELRFRQRVVERGADPAVLWGGVAKSLPKVAVTLEIVLRSAGEPVPGDRAGVWRAAGRLLGVPDDVVQRLAAVHRHAARPDDETVRALARDYLGLLAALGVAVERRLGS